MVMPDTGLLLEPTMPAMYADTDTNRNPATIMITHRTAPLAIADTVLCFNGGRLTRSSERLAGALAEARQGRSGDALREAVVRALLLLVQENSSSARVMVTEMFRTERSWRDSIETWREIALSPLVEDFHEAGVDPVVAGVQAAAIVGAALVAGLEWLVFHPERSAEQVASAVLGTLR